MKHDIDTLVADICASDPELGQDAVAVRAIVSELIAHQPALMIDEGFKTRLRAKLMAEANGRHLQKTAVPWWLIYTVPVGVTAILLFVVYPKLATAPQQPMSPETAYPAADSYLQMDTEIERSMTAPRESDASLKSMVATPDFFTAAFLPDFKSVRVSYAMLGQPSFIVVSGPTGDVAMSQLIISGEHTDIIIPVSGVIQGGVTYTATLYADDGDGNFVAGLDSVVLDQSGLPVTMPIVAQ